MKKSISLFILICFSSSVLAHESTLHQSMVREAYKLLKHHVGGVEIPGVCLAGHVTLILSPWKRG